MNDILLEQLTYIIKKYGLIITERPQRVRTELENLCPNHKEEVNLIVQVLEAGIPSELLKYHGSRPEEHLFSLLTKHLHEKLKLDENYAQWAVKGWAQALGIVQTKKTEPEPPPQLQKDKDTEPDKNKHDLLRKKLVWGFILLAVAGIWIYNNLFLDFRPGSDYTDEKKPEAGTPPPAAPHEKKPDAGTPPPAAPHEKKPDASKKKPIETLRSNPLSVDTEKLREMFSLDVNRRPLKFIENDFVDNRDGTVTDWATGLMWEQSGSKEYIVYSKAQEYIMELNRKNFAGHSDWRLPTLEELLSLMEKEKQDNDLYIQTIFDSTQLWCWSADYRPSGGMWCAYFSYGGVRWPDIGKSSCVRGVRSL